MQPRFTSPPKAMEEKKNKIEEIEIDDNDPDFVVCLSRDQINRVNAVFESEKLCRDLLASSKLTPLNPPCQDIKPETLSGWTKVLWVGFSFLLGISGGFVIGKLL